MNDTFDPALPGLQDALPSWWATQDPTSQLYGLLSTVAAQIDGLGDALDGLAQNFALNTANATGILYQYAYLYGLQSESAPQTQSVLPAVVSTLSAYTGSLNSLVSVLTAWVSNPTSLVSGVPLTFAADGSGLTFPATGGLALYQPINSSTLLFPSGGSGLTFAADGTGLVFTTSTNTGASLLFPASGSGLGFPVYPQAVFNDAVDPSTGQTPPGAGPGLQFPTGNAFISVTEHPGSYTFDVTAASYLDFDRPGLQRLIDRLRPAHCLLGIYSETYS